MVCWFAIFLLVLFALFNSLGVARNCSSISLVFDFYSSLPCLSLRCGVMSDDEDADTGKKRRKTLHGGSDRDTARKQAVLDQFVEIVAVEKRSYEDLDFVFLTRFTRTLSKGTARTPTLE